ncbi:hypothetical protein ACZ90_00405 [Streptomyces albus subsp. albus]|nr:hypothetical protein ACZ90_00405 [Streptomyces albus subsp. albus]
MMRRILNHDIYRSGGTCMAVLSPAEVRADMAWFRGWKVTPYQWSGQDREGNALHVKWISNPPFGTSSLIIYETSGGE